MIFGIPPIAGLIIVNDDRRYFGSFPDALLLIDSEGRLVDCKIPNVMILDMPWRGMLERMFRKYCPQHCGSFLQTGKSIFTGRTTIYGTTLIMVMGKNTLRQGSLGYRITMSSFGEISTEKIFSTIIKQVEKYKNFFYPALNHTWCCLSLTENSSCFSRVYRSLDTLKRR